MDQLEREWEQYNGVGHLSDEGVIGLFADQLIREGQGEKSPIQSLHDDAEKRGDPRLSSAIGRRYAASTLGEQSAHSATPSF